VGWGGAAGGRLAGVNSMQSGAAAAAAAPGQARHAMQELWCGAVQALGRCWPLLPKKGCRVQGAGCPRGCRQRFSAGKLLAAAVLLSSCQIDPTGEGACCCCCCC
jgi:hypothetical protein